MSNGHVFLQFCKNTGSIFVCLFDKEDLCSNKRSYVFLMRGFGCAFFICAKKINNRKEHGKNEKQSNQITIPAAGNAYGIIGSAVIIV